MMMWHFSAKQTRFGTSGEKLWRPEHQCSTTIFHIKHFDTFDFYKLVAFPAIWILHLLRDYFATSFHALVVFSSDKSVDIWQSSFKSNHIQSQKYVPDKKNSPLFLIYVRYEFQ